jgi:hypothetical protein
MDMPVQLSGRDMYVQVRCIAICRKGQGNNKQSLGHTKVLYTLTLHIQDSTHPSKKDPRLVITTFEKMGARNRVDRIRHWTM